MLQEREAVADHIGMMNIMGDEYDPLIPRALDCTMSFFRTTECLHEHQSADVGSSRIKHLGAQNTGPDGGVASPFTARKSSDSQRKANPTPISEKLPERRCGWRTVFIELAKVGEFPGSVAAKKRCSAQH